MLAFHSRRNTAGLFVLGLFLLSGLFNALQAGAPAPEGPRDGPLILSARH